MEAQLSLAIPFGAPLVCLCGSRGGAGAWTADKRWRCATCLYFDELLVELGRGDSSAFGLGRKASYEGAGAAHAAAARR